jgi:Flp pilus assembly protein TadB
MSKKSAKKPFDSLKELYHKLDRKTWLLLLGINLALLGLALYLFFFLDQRYAALGSFLVLVVLDGLIVRQFLLAQNKDSEAFEKEFVQIFAYFAIYIRDGLPVYHALEECISYASSEMEKKLRNLLEAIDNDKSVAPYVAFSENFHSMEIRQLMISIYRMVDEGGGESYIRQFNVLFDALQANKSKEHLEKEDARLANLAMLAMADSALVMLLITLGIVQIIGGYINGI